MHICVTQWSLLKRYPVNISINSIPMKRAHTLNEIFTTTSPAMDMVIITHVPVLSPMFVWAWVDTTFINLYLIWDHQVLIIQITHMVLNLLICLFRIRPGRVSLITSHNEHQNVQCWICSLSGNILITSNHQNGTVVSYPPTRNTVCVGLWKQ